MRVNKMQLINGILAYAESEVVPQVGDKPTQIIVSVAIKSIRTNPALADLILGNQIIKALLDENENGYEIDGLFTAMEESIRQYGPFPVVIPPIPIISPLEKTLTFSESDVAEMKRRIERSAMNG